MKKLPHRIQPGKNISKHSLQGFKYFKEILPLLKKHVVTSYHPRRILQAEQYISLILFYFFNPRLSSLRGISQATKLKNLQKKLDIRATSLSSLSEASEVFDAQMLEPIIKELVCRALPMQTDPLLKDVLQDIKAVDGSLMEALPKMQWAQWLDDQHRAAKLHLVFDIVKGIATDAVVTHGNANEKEIFKTKFLKSDTLYLLDSGYAMYALFNDIVLSGSCFVARLRDNAVFEIIAEKPLLEKDRKAGVIGDMIVNLGCKHKKDDYPRPIRLVEIFHKGDESVRRKSRVSSKKTFRTTDTDYKFIVATDRMDMTAETIAALYIYRWQIELFFRLFKHTLGCTHLLSLSQNGITIQVYCALITNLFISIWIGGKPTKRTIEMFCFYFMGLANSKELEEHIKKQKHKKNTGILE